MKNSIVLFVCFALFNSCQLFNPKPKSEDFFCRVNGKAWRPNEKSISLPSQLRSSLSLKDGRFNITAFNDNSIVYLFLKLQINTSLKIGEYDLNSITSDNHGIYYFSRDLKDQSISQN